MECVEAGAASEVLREVVPKIRAAFAGGLMAIKRDKLDIVFSNLIRERANYE